VQLAPRKLEVEALPDLMDIDSARSEDSNCAAERLLLLGRASQLPKSSAHSAEHVPTARVGSKHGDGNHHATVGLSGAPDDHVARGVPYHAHCSRHDHRSPFFAPMLLTCSARSRECASQALSSGDDWVGGIAY
jgi:hypothetical protein